MASVKDIMTREVVSVKPDTPLQEAAEVLARHGFDGVPVVNDETKKPLLGGFTSRLCLFPV